LGQASRKDAELIWRGIIEHVEADESVYFDHLDKMNTYFAKNLEKNGIKLDNSKNEFGAANLSELLAC